jgi:hypothetical protein
MFSAIPRHFNQFALNHPTEVNRSEEHKAFSFFTRSFFFSNRLRRKPIAERGADLHFAVYGLRRDWQ